MNDLAAEFRVMADQAWASGRYQAGVHLDRAADLIAEADVLAAVAEAHHIAAVARMDQWQAAVRDRGRAP